MTPQEEADYMQLAQQVQREQALRMNAENQVSQMSSFQAGKEPNIIEYQLDVSPTLDRIYHLLSGHVPMKRANGQEYWEEPTDDRLKILSDYGVKQLMKDLALIINPNTLLSNFTEEQIEMATKHYANELNDLILNRYEHFFYYPSPEELYQKYSDLCVKVMINGIARLVTKQAYAESTVEISMPEYKEVKVGNNTMLELVGEKKVKGLSITEANSYTPSELYQKCVQWSEEELKMKFRHYPMIVMLLEQTVHATLLRALKGQERESLRKQLNIHQSLNNGYPGMKNPDQKGGFRNPFTWPK